MSTGPLMTPGRGRRRAGLSGRRRALIAAGVLAVAALAAVLVAIALGHRSSAGAHRAPHAAATRGAAKAPPAPALSPAGFRLGSSHFTLAGLAVQPDPVRLSFHAAPRAGLLFNLSSGRVLWQRNPLRRLPIASLTKMMTALVTVESASAEEEVTVTRDAVYANGSKVGVLPVHRQVPLESLLYGLMLPSGNDAAVALAEHISGSVAGFVRRMNVVAAHRGLGCTRFSSPHGFYDQDNFSCAADLAVLAHLDLEQPRIARIARTYRAIIPFPIKGGKLYLANNNPMLIYGYPGATGLKTGYTVASGRCLVATAERHGVRLGVVLLDSPAPATQARKLLDRAFHDVYHQPPIPEPAIPPQA
jgi:D-alanyl-D-alanine carboxypeptidase (penicillin-binding protein 5/6)